MHRLHGFKTFILCLIALIGFFVISYAMGHEIDGAELAIVIGAIAALYAANDVAGGYREGRQRPHVPDTVATAETINVDASGT